MQDLIFPHPMDDVDYDARIAEMIRAEEEYYASLPIPRAPEVSDAQLLAWELRHDPTL